MSSSPPATDRAHHPQQPSPALLRSLGIKVRDFAYENTLPAILPVPRVPRQVQPAPSALKRPQRDWDDQDGPVAAPSVTPKKPRPLARMPTEPLQQPAVEHTRTLQRIAVRTVCSIFIPPPRKALPTTPLTRSPASPPTSPLTPPLSDSAFPFVVHVDDTSVVPIPQMDSESHPVSFRPALYTRFTLDSRPRSPALGPQDAPPATLASPFLELSSPGKEPGTDSPARRRRARVTAGPAPDRYHLRQRPVPSVLSQRPHRANGAAKTHPRRARGMR